MKKLLFCILLLFLGLSAVFAQAPTHEQLTYQTVVRNAQNQLVFNQNNVTVQVYVCNADGTVVTYSETHTGLSTNANGMLSLMIGSVAPDQGTWADIDWSTAYIKTTVSYNPGSGTVTITHAPAPVTAVPYALQAGNLDNITNILGDAIHDSIVNNISEQIHDSLANALNDYTIRNCDDVNDCVATAIADGNSDINRAIDTVVLNNIGDAIADGNSEINHAIDTVVLNNIGNAIADGNSDINHAIDTVVANIVHDSIVYIINNNVSEQIHDSLANALNDYEIQNCDDVNDCVATAIADGNSEINRAIDTVVLNNIPTNVSDFNNDANYVSTTDLCTTIETNCTNVVLKNGDNDFTGANNFTGGSITVPNAISSDLATALADSCTQNAVSLCDLFVVFDSLSRSIQELFNEVTALKSAVPPTANAPTVSNVTATSMNVKANATSEGAPITSYEFCISTNSDMSGSTCQTVPASDADNYTFTGLTGNTIYYVQYKATNVAGTATSPSVQQRTPAHAPTADVAPLTPTKPAGFKVDVTNIDPKEKTDNTTVQVCYVAKGSGECPDKESSSYTCAAPQVVATPTETENIQTISGLTPSTEYCAIVKVSNGDSTTIYGPYTVTTGADVTMTVTRDPSTATVSLCGDSTADVTFTATITGDNASDFTYAWSNGTSTTSKDTVALAAGTHTITVTATHTTEGYTVTGTASVTIASGGTAVSLGLCEKDGVVTVRTVGGSPNSIDWGDGSMPYSGTVTANSTSNTYTASGIYDIVATNSSGCRAKVTMPVNVPGSTAADRTVKPCDVGSHAAQTGSAYTGNGHSGANHGLETVNGSGKITSVTDYDGNAYPVVQIGSQCWLAENLRVSHSPKTGSNLVVTAVNSYGSKMAAWYSNDQSTYEAKRYGLFYNWCAAMDTANPGAYVEVAYGSYNNNSFNFNPSGNHQGVCPIGWHVPTDVEWNAMESQVSGSDWQASYETASVTYRGSHAGKLSTGCDWSSSSTENAAGNYANAERNESGFSAVPAGIFTTFFGYAGNGAYFWSSSQYTNTSGSVWMRGLNYNNAGMARNSNPKDFGLSVRCVRD